VLDQIGGQIESWRREARMPNIASERRRALRDRARTSAASAVKLAETLVAWARQQPNMTEIRLASFRLMEARAKSVAGLHAPALAILDEIRQIPQIGNDLALLDALGETHFEAALRQWDQDRPLSESQLSSLIESADYYDRILGGVEPDDDGTYPNQWWNAWMQRLRINDILNEGTQDIPLRVKQLRLTDPNLGGEPYKSELERLENKYQLTRQS
jgi:hypothetical protein